MSYMRVKVKEKKLKETFVEEKRFGTFSLNLSFTRSHPSLDKDEINFKR